MKAILTKCLPATDTKPTRIKAYTEGGNQITLAWDACEELAKDTSGNHGQIYLAAARALCEKMKWPGELLGGGTPKGYAFVFKETWIK